MRNTRSYKIIRPILLTAVLVISSTVLTACGKETSSKAKLQIGVVVYNQDDTFISEEITCFKDDVKKLQTDSLSTFVTVKDAAGSQRTEDGLVQELIDGGCNVLCVNLVDRTAPSKIIDMAEEKNIPVIFFNREPVSEDLMLWSKLYYVGCDAQESGIMQGELAADAIKKNTSIDRNGDGKIQYVIIEGEPGHQDAIIRTENAVNTLINKGIQVEKLSYQIANWNRAQAQTKMSQLIGQYGSKIELVLANNDEMALGVLDAYDNKNITEADRPIIFGTDGTEGGLEAVVQGKMAGTVYNDKEGQALNMANLAKAVYLGESLDSFKWKNNKCIYLPYSKVTPENIKSFMNR